MIKLTSILKEIQVEVPFVLTKSGEEFVRSRDPEAEDWGEKEIDNDNWLLRQLHLINEGDKIKYNYVKEKCKILGGDEEMYLQFLNLFKNSIKKGYVTGKLDLLNEVSPAKTSITTPKEPDSNDPENVHKWDVTYEPNFVALVHDLDQVIRDYNRILNKSHLQDDYTWITNLAKLKDVRLNLIERIKWKFPEIHKKLGKGKF